ncbi:MULTISPECIES: ImmA/IrrE family metallo-endopeptidase [unclassified Mesorhizobium]|uniref:ImmA/IrrE family metallo-endopeptidase n=1 Tax=unclassified Mesorhizobium TaxID=325217 RepID=UPI000FD5F85E|nr:MULTISPECIES: ImmA/IrrE family metallo-endopeptidase [unclassified Mesorhizobium]RUV97268.1 ImmA/IrrE family metallo-endopeptidase [Mesorhizobium sp. M5C.F.Ca.IN.020.14.1.1]RUV30509.1 ImmA/IrrE family metallo-endopeptidase [Mesorhizobium sp. M5C.F.Ca.IN.020.32.2.1]RWG50726.1 MAG: ImmA/IrrE family metallo-endopeptidase [Mesorhizobium sp.]RWH55697.1 MAG: ImmA/IrrE family metallo-endopeptidase [Mesorhizobium sp.]RWI70713.1 MAG: ImmA/IrrE family metallo-endopeptidase [Mesorhizobium sp.]
MTVRPIRTDEDYQSALKRAAALFGHKSPKDRDELEVLQAVIERWERSRHTVEAATPAHAIKFRMEQTGLSQRDLIPYLGSKSRVSEILNGQRQPTVDQIRALHQHLNIPIVSLIGSAKHEPAAGTSSTSIAAEGKLRKLGVMKAKENLAGFVSRSKASAPAVAMLRKTRTERTNAKTDLAALEAWCAAVLVRAEMITIKKTKISDPEKAARQLAQLSVFSDWNDRIVAELHSIGIVLVILEHLPGTFLDGAAMCRRDGVPVIALTLRHDRLDNFWFTLLHEFAHVICHLSADRQVILDDLDVASSEAIEAEADTFARNALIPPAMWRSIDKDSSTEEVLEVARRAGVHPAVAAGRWRFQYSDYRRFSKLIGRGEVKSALLPA